HASWAENVLASMMSEQGDLEGGRKRFEAARQLAHAIGATYDEGLATLNQGVTLERLGEGAEARKWLEGAIVLFKEVGSSRGEGGTLGELAHVRGLEGDLPAARREIDAAVRMLEASNNSEDAAPHIADRCAMAVAARDLGVAKTLCTKARDAKVGSAM